MRNSHLSFSRISRFENCPLAYKLHYIDKLQAEPGVALRFGKAIHAVLEHLIKEVVDQELVAPLSVDRAKEVLKEYWAAENVGGYDVFQEGMGILRQFVRDQGIVDHREVLAVEKEFHLQVGPFDVLGFIDRVDWIDDETICVVDYKSNRQLFTRDELDSSLQMSLYELAARQLWPWAKNVQLSFWMLRHGLKQETRRTPEQLADALAYVESLGWQMERATDFPSRINGSCPYCDHRAHCSAYSGALKGHRDTERASTRDLEAVAREREEVASLAKILYSRKEELDDVLKAHLRESDELVINGIRYRMLNTTSHEFPLGPTVELLSGAVGIGKDELINRIAAVDKKALDSVLKEVSKSLDKASVSLLKAELEARAETKHSPRLWAKEAK